MKQELEYQIAAICQELSGTEIQVDLTRPEEQHGDYATNVALQLAGKLGKNPREIAEELAVKLRENLGGEVSDVSVAGPGFLLYTTLVGDSISRLLQTAGANVHRLNYGGDVGLHVGKTMWAIIQELGGEHPEKLAEVPEESRLDWLSTRYVEGNNAYQDDEIAKAGIIAYNKQVYELHTNKDHDSPFAQIYWMGREWSYQGFTKLYQQLQVESFEKFIPESEVTPVGLDIVKRGLEEGVFKQSDGAVVFEGEPHGLHTRVFINSNGLPTYEAKDLGLAATKWEQYHFDLGIIITANDIVEYMKVVLKALDHFYPEIVERSKHLTHGIIKLPGGVKMSSRLGNILRADDILDQTREALQAAGREVKDETMLAAVKYAFIKNRMGGDIIYDPAESVSLEGNSGPYLQYAHARAQSILAKAGNVPGLADETALQPDERSLARKISEFTEIVDKAVNDLMPHHIATYLYELAQAFNRFYENNRVIGDERQEARLALVSIYAKTLKDGLSLLGITAPDRM
jgi:arginyl-tRNA synthetase